MGGGLSGPHWPDRVGVVRTEPMSATRVLKRSDLAQVEIDIEADYPTLQGDPLGFRLAE